MSSSSSEFSRFVVVALSSTPVVPPNCALHAALICRALYVDTNISVVTPAAVAHFRKSLGELLQQCRHEFPSFLQLGDYRGLDLVNAIFEALPRV